MVRVGGFFALRESAPRMRSALGGSEAYDFCTSERNVILVRLDLGCRQRFLRWRRAARRLAIRAAHELHAPREDLRREALDPAPVGPLARLQGTLHVDQRALRRVLLQELRGGAEADDPVPLRPFLLLAGLILPSPGGGCAFRRS